MAWTPGASKFHLPSAGTTSTHRTHCHSGFYAVPGLEPRGFVHDGQVLYQLSYILATPWMSDQGHLFSLCINLLRAILSSAFRVSEAEQHARKSTRPGQRGQGVNSYFTPSYTFPHLQKEGK